MLWIQVSFCYWFKKSIYCLYWRGIKFYSSRKRKISTVLHYFSYFLASFSLNGGLISKLWTSSKAMLAVKKPIFPVAKFLSLKSRNRYTTGKINFDEHLQETILRMWLVKIRIGSFGEVDEEHSRKTKSRSGFPVVIANHLQNLSQRRIGKRAFTSNRKWVKNVYNF